MELSRTQFPAGGWSFFQPQTGWHAPNPVSNTFGQQVVNIIKHRMANPAITVRHGLSTDPVAVGNELEAYTRRRLNIPTAPPVPPPNPSLPQPPAPQAVVDGSRGLIRVAQGSGPILEWFASGRPAVDRALAEKRAGICVNCPKNDNSQLTLLQWFVVQAGKVIASALQSRQDLKLESTQDAKLGVCSACLCPMRTKIHCPLDIITNHLKPEVRADLAPQCWIANNDA